LSQMLFASVHDVRYFTSLMRGINFANRANVTLSVGGLIINVEEARTLLGTAYIFSEAFDQYIYNPNAGTAASATQGSEQEQVQDPPPNAAIEIPINTLVECLNIFGTAGLSSSSNSKETKTRRWRRVGEESDHEGGANDGPSDRRRGAGGGAGAAPSDNSRIDQFFGAEKRTGMRMSYAGPGYPLTFLIAEETGGPTATVELTTFEPEPQLELPFDADDAVLRIILKSSWLRDALSELDPSCEKLTIIGNPPPASGRAARMSEPRLRLKAAGTFGTTEMDYPSDKEVLETCDCTLPVSFSYSFKHIAKSARALQASHKTSLRIDGDGLLSLQFLMPAPTKKGGMGASNCAFIEFRCLALDDGQ
ncbi:hypothetical protein PHLGIDRAFT_78869, partial [Phlebiopsis gigantea 11061_1 CR5-6]